MEKSIKGSIGFELKLSDDKYEIKCSPTVENELTSFIITNEIIKTLKAGLIEVEAQSKGKNKLGVRDRIKKVTATEYILNLLIEETVNGLLYPSEAEEPKTE